MSQSVGVPVTPVLAIGKLHCCQSRGADGMVYQLLSGSSGEEMVVTCSVALQCRGVHVCL